MTQTKTLTTNHGAASRTSESAEGNARQESTTTNLVITPEGLRPERRKAKRPPKQITADDVLKSFNTWAYKREQPTHPDKLLSFIADSIASSEPVSFVLYWGRGPRERADRPDVACLDYIASLGERVKSVHAPGAAFTLIFTDTHAKLNGYPPQTTMRYFAGIEGRAKGHGFFTCFLSDLVKAAEKAGPVEQVTEVPADVRQLLLDSAAKWYRGEGGIEHGALTYYNCNMYERRAVELAFPKSIFVTFNGSNLLSLFPTGLPIFYMYSLRRGFSVKPWFLSADATANEGAARERVA